MMTKIKNDPKAVAKARLARRKTCVAPAPLRVIIGYDPDPDMSWLEQWDTPATYYGTVPQCSHGFDMLYDKSHEWRADHSDGDGDQCSESVTFEGWGKSAVVVDARRGLGSRNLVPFEVYAEYWGDPERHVMLYARAEIQCAHCDEWKTYDSLYGIDFMDDGAWKTGTFTEAECTDLPNKAGLREIVQSVIAEARQWAAEARIQVGASLDGCALLKAMLEARKE